MNTYLIWPWTDNGRCGYPAVCASRQAVESFLSTDGAEVTHEEWGRHTFFKVTPIGDEFLDRLPGRGAAVAPAYEYLVDEIETIM